MTIVIHILFLLDNKDCLYDTATVTSDDYCRALHVECAYIDSAIRVVEITDTRTVFD